MAKYRAIIKSFIDGYIREEGEEFEYAGVPGSSLQPLDDEAEKAKSEAMAAKPGLSSLSKSAAPIGDSDEVTSDELASLQDQYTQLFQKAPHPAAKAETLREKIAERRKELGV